MLYLQKFFFFFKRLIFPHLDFIPFPGGGGGGGGGGGWNTTYTPAVESSLDGRAIPDLVDSYTARMKWALKRQDFLIT